MLRASHSPGESLKVEIAVAKAPKYAVLESGDSVEVTERPFGGLSLVMADGQRSGRSAKAISNITVRKAISLLAEGVRDGAAARAAHDYLRTQRGGQVSAELTIISVDLETRTLVISRNSRCPVLLAQFLGGVETTSERDGDFAWRVLDEPAEPVGVRARARPVITELPLAAGQMLVAFTDGLMLAGARQGSQLDPMAEVTRLSCCAAPEAGAGPTGRAGDTGSSTCTAQQLADGLLDCALSMDDGRPGDDVTVVVVQVLPWGTADGPEIRRMTVSFPVSPV